MKGERLWFSLLLAGLLAAAPAVAETGRLTEALAKAWGYYDYRETRAGAELYKVYYDKMGGPCAFSAALLFYSGDYILPLGLPKLKGEQPYLVKCPVYDDSLPPLVAYGEDHAVLLFCMQLEYVGAIKYLGEDRHPWEEEEK